MHTLILTDGELGFLKHFFCEFSEYFDEDPDKISLAKKMYAVAKVVVIDPSLISSHRASQTL